MFSSKLAILAITATAVYAVPAPQLISSLSSSNASSTVDIPLPTSADFSVPSVPSAIPTDPFSITFGDSSAPFDAPYSHHGHHHGGDPSVITITETITVNPGGPISSASSVFDPSASVSASDIPTTTDVPSDSASIPTSVTGSVISSSFTISSSAVTDPTITPSASLGSASVSGSDLPSSTAIPSVDPSASASASTSA